MHALLYFLAQLFEVLLKFLKGVRLVPSTRETLGDISFGMISIRPLITRINHGPWDVVTWRKGRRKGNILPPFPVRLNHISIRGGEHHIQYLSYPSPPPSFLSLIPQIDQSIRERDREMRRGGIEMAAQ